MSLRLMHDDELVDDPSPEACVELVFGPLHEPGGSDAVICAKPLRMTPADLLRLHMESELVLREIRAEATRAEIAWQQRVGRWYEEGRIAVESRDPDTALLQRVLEGLRRQVLVPV
ncbi:hypothetical protein [Streptomyces sp. NBC_00366]|uniref:hypothetical protein n=1 Tax=Streptomyces sp. NBC_00366 TaxID=2975727 RepID=UPI002E263322